MARYVLQSVLRRNCQCAFDWSIKSDPHAGAADESEKSRTHLTMHVDDQIIFRAADLLEQIKERHQCRSEEHTSELQSQSNLVCRLLLEKKKKNKNPT